MDSTERTIALEQALEEERSLLAREKDQYAREKRSLESELRAERARVRHLELNLERLEEQIHTQQHTVDEYKKENQSLANVQRYLSNRSDLTRPAENQVESEAQQADFEQQVLLQKKQLVQLQRSLEAAEEQAKMHARRSEGYEQDLRSVRAENERLRFEMDSARRDSQRLAPRDTTVLGVASGLRESPRSSNPSNLHLPHDRVTLLPRDESGDTPRNSDTMLREPSVVLRRRTQTDEQRPLVSEQKTQEKEFCGGCLVA